MGVIDCRAVRRGSCGSRGVLRLELGSYGSHEQSSCEVVRIAEPPSCEAMGAAEPPSCEAMGAAELSSCRGAGAAGAVLQ